MSRHDRLTQIQRLDPVQDHIEICHLITGYEFPWDVTRALEVALFRTFCVPSIAKLLDRTGEFHHHPQKRYDDTGLLLSSILKWGYNSEPGQAAIQRMNRIHHHFPITNSDYLYVLSTFIYEPVRWVDRFGWRRLSEIEKQGLFYFWYRVGQQMQIQDIPDTYAAFEQYNLTYEDQYFCYSPATQRVGESTLQLFLSWFPAPLRPIARPLVYALLDQRMLTAFGFPQPTTYQRQMVETLLRSRGWLLRYFPPRQQPSFYVDASHRSYPQGYTLEDLGPPGLLRELNQK